MGLVFRRGVYLGRPRGRPMTAVGWLIAGLPLIVLGAAWLPAGNCHGTLASLRCACAWRRPTTCSRRADIRPHSYIDGA